MTMPVPRPLFALLLAAIVGSVITALAPVGTPAADAAKELLPEARDPARPAEADNGGFRRPLYRRPPPPPSPSISPEQAPPALPSAPVPSAPEASPTPAPIAPSMPEAPFVYLGRLAGDGRDVVFLGEGDDAIAVAPGARINSRWTLDHADDEELVLRYLPLNKTTKIRIAP